MKRAIVIISLSALALYNGTIEGYRDAIRSRETTVGPALSKNAHSLMTLAVALDGSMDYDLMAIDRIKVVENDEVVYRVEYRMTVEEENAVSNFIARFSSIDSLVHELDSYQYDESCYTPYRAINNKKYNCQSASMLIKLLCDRLNIKSRILVGLYNGEPHGLVYTEKGYIDYALYREGITGLYESELSAKYDVQEIGGK